MKNISFIFLTFLFFLGACSKEEQPILPEPFPERLVNLSALKVGQQSMYLRYSTFCETQAQDFQYSNDTMVLEVIEQNGQLAFKESYTRYSPLYDNSRPSLIYSVIKQDDFLLLKDRLESALFFFYANDTLRLDPVHSTTISQNDCLLVQDGQPFIGNDIAWLDRMEIGNIVQEDKTVVSCEPFEDLDAYLIYDQYQLYQSHVSTFENLGSSVETRLLVGWVLMEE